MQNAWSMDFIPWISTHVSQLKFILLESLPVGWWGWDRGHIKEGYPIPPMELQFAQMQGDRAASSVTEGGQLFDNAEGDRHWLCTVLYGITGEGKGQVQMAWKWIKWRSIMQHSGKNDTAWMCFSLLTAGLGCCFCPSLMIIGDTQEKTYKTLFIIEIQ